MDKNIQKSTFLEVIQLINAGRNNAIRIVNSELLSLYWNVGKYISNKVNQEKWGKSVVKELADFLKKTEPTLKGFGDKNLWRMKQFYEIYSENEKLASLWRQLSWTHNRIIMTLKTSEEREFYLMLSVKQNYSVRNLERLISSATYERTLLANEKRSEIVKKLPQDTENIFKDSYVLEFLNLPKVHKEKDLQQALINSLKEFILELGSGFSFIGQEYRLQVGNDDFFIDLLFFHRNLQCLIAIELKITKFNPKDLGQLEFYLEALDRDVKLPQENPSIGILLCREKDDEVVEYALSRSISPAVISDYETKLLPKDLLRKKLNEFYKILEEK